MHVWKFTLGTGQNRETCGLEDTHTAVRGGSIPKEIEKKKCILNETPVVSPHLVPRRMAQGLSSFSQKLKEYSLGNMTCSKDTSGVIQQTARPQGQTMKLTSSTHTFGSPSCSL